MPPRLPSNAIRDFLLILVAALLVYGNTLRNELHLDDFYRVRGNPGIQAVFPLSRHFFDPGTSSTLDRIVQFRPFLPLSLSLNYAISGEDLVPLHLTNLGIQCIASLLAYFLVLELMAGWRRGGPEAGASGTVALGVAALFTLHPVSGIMVNYICARDLSMMMLFMIAGLLGYARMLRLGETGWRFALVLFMLSCSILSKTDTVVAPLLVLAFEVIVARSPLRSTALWRRFALVCAVPLAYFAWEKWGLGFSDLGQVLSADTPRVWSYPLLQVRLHTFHYLRNFVWPFPMRELPDVTVPWPIDVVETVLGGCVLLASLIIAVRQWAKRPLLSFCIAAYWICVLPTASIFPFHQAAVDYRVYASSVFLYLGALGVLAERASKRALLGIVLGLSVLAGSASHRINTVWATEESLWAHSVAYGGDSVAHMNLARALKNRADPRVERGFREALRLDPNNVLARLNLGLLLVDLGRKDEGLNACIQSREMAPRWGQVRYWVSYCFERVGRGKEAAAEAVEAAALDPKQLEYRERAVELTRREGDFARSLELTQGFPPSYSLTHFQRGYSLQLSGRQEEAITEYRLFLNEAPNHAQGWFNLAFALMTANRCDEAVPAFRETLRLRPGYGEAHLHLHACLLKLGHGDEAREEQALYDAYLKGFRR